MAARTTIVATPAHQIMKNKLGVDRSIPDRTRLCACRASPASLLRKAMSSSAPIRTGAISDTTEDGWECGDGAFDGAAVVEAVSGRIGRSIPGRKKAASGNTNEAANPMNHMVCRDEAEDFRNARAATAVAARSTDSLTTTSMIIAFFLSGPFRSTRPADPVLHSRTPKATHPAARLRPARGNLQKTSGLDGESRTVSRWSGAGSE